MEVPKSMKLQMEEFTKNIRVGSTFKDLELYREFIVSNVEGVLENTFPYFSMYATDKDKDNLIKYFLQENNSLDPAFHQIATEFLKCSKNIDLRDELKKLLEFDWLIFNTEVSPEKAFDNEQINVEIDYKAILTVNANLTLNFISLPFEICELEEKFDIVDEVYYAVYRNINNKVTYQKISIAEHLILKSLVNDGVKETFGAIDYKNLNAKSKHDLMKKITNWHNQNMIRLNFKGENYDK